MEKPVSDESFDDLRRVLDSIVKIDERPWLDLQSGLKRRMIQKGSVLWDYGQYCKSLVFVRHGLIRSYSLKAGKEVTHAFYQENSLFYDDHSFLSGQTCKKTYEALENGELLFIYRTHLHSLYDRHKCFERLGRLAVEHAHVKMIESMERINHGTAGEGYGHLLAHHRGLLQRVPQKLIASFLNISPEHLSRIRAAIK